MCAITNIRCANYSSFLLICTLFLCSFFFFPLILLHAHNTHIHAPNVLIIYGEMIIIQTYIHAHTQAKVLMTREKWLLTTTTTTRIHTHIPQTNMHAYTYLMISSCESSRSSRSQCWKSCTRVRNGITNGSSRNAAAARAVLYVYGKR